MDVQPYHTSDNVPIFSEWAKTFVTAGEATGMSFDIASSLEGWLTEAGFVNVNIEGKRVPVGGKTDLGKYNLVRLHGGVFDFSGRILSNVLKVSFPNTRICYIANGSKWSTDDIIDFLTRVQRELKLCRHSRPATHYEIL
jgi:hypothetical protein